MPNDIFVISDLHIGDGGPRDNFGHKGSDRPQQLMGFLDYVEKEEGELIVAGDLFEFWQASLSRVVVYNLRLLDRLAALKATYVLGNHDADLVHFIGRNMLTHPLFRSMSGPIARTVAGKTFKFMHGHEVDPFNAGDTPGWGRMLTIFAGICEDKNGSPMIGEVPIETMLSCVGRLGLLLLKWAANKWAGRKGEKTESIKQEETPSQNPDRAAEMLAKYAADHEAEGYDVGVVGHTHQPGRIGDWYFNTGSWATTDNNFVRISSSGEVQVLDWNNGDPRPNDTVLTLPQKAN